MSEMQLPMSAEPETTRVPQAHDRRSAAAGHEGIVEVVSATCFALRYVDEAEIGQTLQSRGLTYRFFVRWMRSITKTWHMFSGGMTLFDAIDGAFMNVAHGCGFAQPVRRVRHNLVVTGLSKRTPPAWERIGRGNSLIYMRDDKLLSKIAGLLRQAEGTDNPHEAEAFMDAAQRLATASAIDLALARAHDPAERRRTTPISRQIAVGEAGKRGLKTYVQLFVAIARANDVTVDVAGNSTFVLAYGYASDIDTCEALYTSLVVQMVSASDAYLRSGAYKDEMSARVVRRGSGWSSRRVVERKQLAPITARLNFQSAFAERIGQRLAEARDAQRAEAVAEETDDTQSQGLSSTAVVLRDKEIEVRDFYRSESSARGTWRPTSASAGYSEGARRAGDRAGRRAKLGPDREFGAPRGAIEG